MHANPASDTLARVQEHEERECAGGRKRDEEEGTTRRVGAQRNDNPNTCLSNTPSSVIYARLDSLARVFHVIRATKFQFHGNEHSTRSLDREGKRERERERWETRQNQLHESSCRTFSLNDVIVKYSFRFEQRKEKKICENLAPVILQSTLGTQSFISER